jgi:hypothetical protein
LLISAVAHLGPLRTGRLGFVDGVDLGAMVTHRFRLNDIEAAYDLFADQRDGVTVALGFSTVQRVLHNDGMLAASSACAGVRGGNRGSACRRIGSAFPQ